jgi:subtilisin family serine protease
MFPEHLDADGHALELLPGQLAVQLRDGIDEAGVLRLEAELGVELVPWITGASLRQRHWVTGPDRVETTVGRLRRRTDVELVSPVYRVVDDPNDALISYGHVLFVGTRGGLDRPAVAGALRSAGYTVERQAADAPSGAALRVAARGRRRVAPTAEELDQLREELATIEGATYVRPAWIFLDPVPCSTPNDPQRASQWALNRIEAYAAWDITKGSPNVVIAILDVGCDLSHEDLVSKYVPSTSWRNVPAKNGNPADTTGHGTHVAGIAAAATDNLKGVSGVGWACSLMPVRVHDDIHVVETDLIDAVSWAVGHGAHVINISFWAMLTAQVELAFSGAKQAGVTIAVASANFGGPSVQQLATSANVVAVGATDQTDALATFSSYGDGLDLVAPGVGILSTWFDGGYQVDEGTSMAAPHVAALAGLLHSRYGTITPDEVLRTLAGSADKLGGYTYGWVSGYPYGSREPHTGYGRINARKAVDHADVYLRDQGSDTGLLPDTPGVFWESPDIVIRDARGWNPTSQPLVPGRSNYLYVQGWNHGPNTARNVSFSARVVAYMSTGLSYPADWAAIDAYHFAPTQLVPLVNLGNLLGAGAGTSVIAEFEISAADVAMIQGWEAGGWHPCVVAEVHADNDYNVIPPGALPWQANNLAQRNISVAGTATPGGVDLGAILGGLLGGVLGHKLRIDRSELPAEAEVLIDPRPTRTMFPHLDLAHDRSDEVTDPHRWELAGGALVNGPDGHRFRADAPVGWLMIPGDGTRLREIQIQVRIPEGTPGGVWPLRISQHGIDGLPIGGITHLVSALWSEPSCQRLVEERADESREVRAPSK